MLVKSIYVALIVYAMAAVIAFMVAGLIKLMSVVVNRQSKPVSSVTETTEGGA